METLKVRYKLYDVHFEAEGNELTVKEQVADFKSFVIDQLLPRINIVPQQTILGAVQPPKALGAITEPISVSFSEVPTLQDVKLRDLAKGEIDWMLVYSYYASDGGSKEFTRKDIDQLYVDTGRRNSERVSHASTRIKRLVKGLYIKSTNDQSFILLEKGKRRAMEIFKGNSKSKGSRVDIKTASKENKVVQKDKVESLPSKNKKIKSGSSIAFVDLNIPPTEIAALTEFFQSKKPKTQNEEVAVVMKWYKDYSKVSEISLEDINYLLSVCSEVPTALEQVLVNMKGSKFRWVSNKENGKVSLTSIGETYVITKLPKS
jgi:hypothetical protein